MTARFAQFLAAVVFSCLAGLARAGIPAIDIFHAPSSVPDSGGSFTVMGPCYCDQTMVWSPVIRLQPGTFDFGTVREYWVPSGYTPDGGPDQDNFWLLFAPVMATSDYPYTYTGLPDYVYPTSARCAQTDDACNAAYTGAYVDFHMIYTIPQGDDAIQIGLIAKWQYTAAVPEPAAPAMLLLGATLVAAVGRRRYRAS